MNEVVAAVGKADLGGAGAGKGPITPRCMQVCVSHVPFQRKNGTHCDPIEVVFKCP